MTSLKNFAEAEKRLAQYVPLSKAITGKDITLSRMRPLLEILGNPQERLKVIHVAGTSGKTSTSYYIASLLTLSGNKTGLTVSPHIDSVTERVQINMIPLGELEFTVALSEFLGILDKSKVEPTYFELLVAFAYWYFAKAGVDYAVVETGLGGLHDGTNVADRKDKLCIITDIGLDHMHVLGNTVEEIAKQKAGIIHSGNHAIMYRQPEPVLERIKSRCLEVGAYLHLLDESVLLNPLTEDLLRGFPEFQQRNFLLAYGAYDFIKKRDGINETEWGILSEAIKVRIPGRMDEVVTAGKRIIMDGAHNEQKTQSFVSSFRRLFPERKVPVLLSLKSGKEYKAVLPLLKEITSKLIVTNYEASQDLPVVSIKSGDLALAARAIGFDSVIDEPDKDRAYEMLLSEVDNLGVITGSFYLIGQLRKTHKELTNV